jgi:hypothetical protein
MTVLDQARSVAVTSMRRPCCVAVQWNMTLDRVLARMDAVAGDETVVMQGDQPVGWLSRSTIEQLQCQGNATSCIAAVDAMERQVP